MRQIGPSLRGLGLFVFRNWISKWLLAVHITINHVQHQGHDQPDAKERLFIEDEVNETNWVDPMEARNKKIE